MSLVARYTQRQAYAGCLLWGFQFGYLPLVISENKGPYTTKYDVGESVFVSVCYEAAYHASWQM